MGRKLIINSNNEMTYNTVDAENRKFRELIKRILDELKGNFDNEENVDSNSGIQQVELFEELS